MPRRLGLARAWEEAAVRVENLTGYMDGYLCCEIDELHNEGRISTETRDTMLKRIAEDLGVEVDDLGYKAAYQYGDDEDTEEKELAARAENRAARVMAALFFAEEVSPQ